MSSLGLMYFTYSTAQAAFPQDDNLISGLDYV